MTPELIKESIIRILEILSTADPVRDAVTIEGESIPCQYVIDLVEVNYCKELLERINNPDGNTWVQNGKVSEPSQTYHNDTNEVVMFTDIDGKEWIRSIT